MTAWNYYDLPEALKARINAQEKKDIQIPKPIAKSARKSKYGNVKTIIDGHTFDSKKEAKWYINYKSLVADGHICDLKLQPEFVLQEAFTDNQGNKHRAITYKADFAFFEWGSGEVVVDVKSSKTFKTEVYRIKKKLLLAKYRDIVFREVY